MDEEEERKLDRMDASARLCVQREWRKQKSGGWSAETGVRMCVCVCRQYVCVYMCVYACARIYTSLHFNTTRDRHGRVRAEHVECMCESEESITFLWWLCRTPTSSPMNSPTNLPSRRRRQLRSHELVISNGGGGAGGGLRRGRGGEVGAGGRSG